MPDNAPALHRGVTLVLVLAVHLFLLFLLLRLAPPFEEPPPAPMRPTSISLVPNSEAAPERTKAATAERAQGGASAAAAALSPPKRPDIPDPPDAPDTTQSSSGIWSQVIPMRGREFAAADISRMPSQPKAQAGAGEGERGTAAGAASGDSEAVGTAPNGETLYHADWYRKPTRAELATYLPPTASTGWGIIACRTAPNYRVDDCREIGQSPAGSGLASAVRQAAWQFRVLPPRIGGRQIIGAWVRIRIEYTRGEASD